MHVHKVILASNTVNNTPTPLTTPTPSHNIPTIFAIKIFWQNRKHTYPSVHPIKIISSNGMKHSLESMSNCSISSAENSSFTQYSSIKHRCDVNDDTANSSRATPSSGCTMEWFINTWWQRAWCASFKSMTSSYKPANITKPQLKLTVVNCLLDTTTQVTEVFSRLLSQRTQNRTRKLLSSSIFSCRGIKLKGCWSAH